MKKRIILISIALVCLAAVNQWFSLIILYAIAHNLLIPQALQNFF